MVVDHVEPSEGERPEPKITVVEQGLHPHPGPGGDVTAADAFEYCWRYSHARLVEVQRNAETTPMTSIRDDPWWTVEAPAVEPVALSCQQVERIVANRSAAFRIRAALAESRDEQMGIGWIEDQLAEIMGEELTQPMTDPTQSEVCL